MRSSRVVIASLGAAVLVIALAVLHQQGGGSPSATSGGNSRQVLHQTRPPTTTAEELRLRRALRDGVDEAARLGGQVEAAAMLDHSSAPLVAASAAGAANRYTRMWSMSKVATMIALLRSLGWGNRPGETPSPEVLESLVGALTRSENCRQRRVVLELQRAAGGIPAAREAIDREFASIDADAVPGSQVAPPETLCLPFLSQQREVPDPLAPTLLLGTSRWDVGGAARLAHALAVDSFGAALSDKVLELMAAPKQPSRESLPGELTAPLDWGAGKVFADLDPAYKAGWGGSLNGNFLAGQIAVVPLPGHGHLSLAVVFHPDVQPARDDPGITVAPKGIEAVMRAVRSALEPLPAPAETADGEEPLGSD
jgi:hypothetical protein